MRKKMVLWGAVLGLALAGVPVSSQASEAEPGTSIQIEKQADVTASEMSEAEKIFFSLMGNQAMKTSPETIPYTYTPYGEDWMATVTFFCDLNDNPKYVLIDRDYGENVEYEGAEAKVYVDYTTYDVYLQWSRGYEQWELENDYNHNTYYMERILHEHGIYHADGSYSYVQNWSFEEEDAEATEQVRSFVSRMYTVALGRAAEAQGLNDWTSRLLSHEIDGAGIANGFIMSDEFKNKNVSNETYVDILYHTFFDRDPDEGGRVTWLAVLANGNSRNYVLAGFVNSVEFDQLCGRYGIVRGEMQVSEVAVNPGVRSFVERCYTKVLGREGEKAGVEDWTNCIATGTMSAEDVAKSFFFSDEYINKQTDNEAFVETLYQTFMDRASDPAGKSDWVGRLSAGVGRREVLEGFSRSEEFAEILRKYGL